MKKQLDKSQLQACIKGLDISQQTIEIARGVLVEGKPQSEYVKALGLTRGAVSQAVSRVWDAHMAKNLPKGFAMSPAAVLPEHQAFIVKKWAEEAAKKQGKKA